MLEAAAQQRAAAGRRTIAVSNMASGTAEDTPTEHGTQRGTLTIWWGVLGVALVFASASFRLGERGVRTVVAGLTPAQWLLLVALTAVFVYGEGVRALQRKYVPHVLRRVELLRAEQRWWYRLLAPLHALSLIGADTRLLLKSWAGTAAIAGAVAVVRSFAEPWRGITDVAVAAALAWGTYALMRAALRTFR
jgi:hypothetical protein